MKSLDPAEPTFESTARALSNIRSALDQSAIVAITDPSGKIIHVNDKFCEISKYSREELLGNTHRMVNSAYHSADFFIELWKTISSGKTWEGEIRNRAKDGSFYWVNTTIVPFLDAKGVPEQYVSIRYEITRRKVAETQLRLHAAQLEQSLEKIREQEAQVLMQDRLASVGLLASSLAHEIGTPLGVIRGRAEYLALQLQENETIRKNVDVIISQIDRVSALIRSLLNLARGDGARGKTQVDLGAVLAEVLELMGHELKKNHIRIQNDMSAQPPIQVMAESASLHQVFLNLLVNSVHAIESAIRMQGRVGDHWIRFSSALRGGNWEIEVADSGCGISEANQRNLFKPFFTTKDIGAGTGLGLVTCFRIIESWNGKIQVQSVEGQGTSFRLYLPKGPS